jgi:hypothetical protein
MRRQLAFAEDYVSVPGTTPVKNREMLVRPAENNADGFGVQFLRPEPACVAISDHADVTNVTPT